MCVCMAVYISFPLSSSLLKQAPAQLQTVGSTNGIVFDLEALDGLSKIHAERRGSRTERPRLMGAHSGSKWRISTR